MRFGPLLESLNRACEPQGPQSVYKYDHENTRRPVCPETKVGSQEEVTKVITKFRF